MVNVRQIIQGNVLVSHGMETDKKMLEHFIPPSHGIRDIQAFLAWKRSRGEWPEEVGNTSLAFASDKILKRTIRTEGKADSPVDDAKAAMEIYLHFREEWEASQEPFLFYHRKCYVPQISAYMKKNSSMLPTESSNERMTLLRQMSLRLASLVKYHI